jgi:hypothetical protein
MAGRSSQGGAVDPDALLKKADKLSVVSLTQWKPDYEQAAGLFEQAGEQSRPTHLRAVLLLDAGDSSGHAPTAGAFAAPLCRWRCTDCTLVPLYYLQLWLSRTAGARVTPPPRTRSCPTARRSWESACGGVSLLGRRIVSVVNPTD